MIIENLFIIFFLNFGGAFNAIKEMKLNRQTCPYDIWTRERDRWR